MSALHLPNPLLVDLLQDLLHQQTDGYEEIALMKALETARPDVFQRGDLNDKLNLFQSHFVLFNALYHLQQQWLDEASGYLAISPSLIQKQALTETSDKQPLNTEVDHLKDFFLDPANLNDTDRQQIEQWLDNFWNMQPCTSDEELLLILELSSKEKYSWAAIQKKYRQLSMQYHPDRGGNTEKLITINQAYQLLKKRYQQNPLD